MRIAIEAHDWLQKFYNHILLFSNLPEAEEALKHLKSRGISENTIREFNLGISPRQSSTTITFLKQKSFSVNDMISKKVLRRYRSGNITDPMRGRLLFPILDYQDRTVAFGGRALDKNNKIKYLNSPDTEVFTKGDNLYGLSQARSSIEEKNFLILFEGYFDVLQAYENGIKNSVSSLGTALTLNQGLLIKHTTSNVVIAFDGDEAGRENAFRSAEILKRVGCNAKIAEIPDDLDPDDYIQKYGRKRFLKEIICPSKKYLDSLIDYHLSKYNLSNPIDCFVSLEKLLDKVPTNQTNELLKRIANKLNITVKGDMFL